MTLATVALFFAGQADRPGGPGWRPGSCSWTGSGSEKVYESVDWPLLVMFAGLFVVVHAFEANVVRTWGIDRWHTLLDSRRW